MLFRNPLQILLLVFYAEGSNCVMTSRFLSFSLSILCVFAPLREVFAVDFQKEILPLLEENCLDCHGPDKQKSEFRVDQRAVMLKGGDSGLASLVPGDPEASYLIEVVNGSDPDMLMPPKGDPLTADQVALLEHGSRREPNGPARWMRRSRRKQTSGPFSRWNAPGFPARKQILSMLS